MQEINPFSTKLPVLEAMIEVTGEKKLINVDRVVFVCIQHLLYTTFTLLESLTRLGVLPENIHVMGKSYSSCPLVIQKLIDEGYCYYPNASQEQLGCFAQYFKKDIDHMWKVIYEDLQKKKIEHIIILDDGGSCLTNVPQFITQKYQVTGVEQTTSGLNNTRMCNLPFPVIEVAISAAKQYLESPLIADAVVKKLACILPVTQTQLSCAVVGLGAIGRAVTQKLLSLNHQVITYDNRLERNKSLNGALRVFDLETAFHEADYIFGCSGRDITENLEISSIKRDKTFISCSSQDKEFQSLLKTIQQNNFSYTDVRNNICFSLENEKTINLFRGGFPINFDNSGESVGALDIQLTRGLLLGGMIQGILSHPQHNTPQENIRYALHPDIQSFVVSHWIPYGSTHLFETKLLNHFQDRRWIKDHSGDTSPRNRRITECFQNPISLGAAA